MIHPGSSLSMHRMKAAGHDKCVHSNHSILYVSEPKWAIIEFFRLSSPRDCKVGSQGDFSICDNMPSRYRGGHRTVHAACIAVFAINIHTHLSQLQPRALPLTVCGVQFYDSHTLCALHTLFLAAAWTNKRCPGQFCRAPSDQQVQRSHNMPQQGLDLSCR